jgi:hypothetical protein
VSGLLAFTITYDETRKEWELWTPDWPSTYHRSLRAARAYYYAAYRAHLLAEAAPGTEGANAVSVLPDGPVPAEQAGAQPEQNPR